MVERRFTWSVFRCTAFRYLFMFLLLITLTSPDRASADSISAVIEQTYSHSDTKTTEPSGSESKSKSDVFLEQLNLTIDKMFYPNLKFTTGGVFQFNQLQSEQDNLSSDTNASTLSPFAELGLSTGFISAQTSYRRREDRSETNDVSAPTEINETYTATFGLRPADLPTLDFIYSRRYLYDRDKDITNLQDDNYTWSSQYRPNQDAEFNYTGNYSIGLDNLNDTENTSLINSGRVSYSHKLLDDRIALFTSYNILSQDSTIKSTGGTGNLFIPVFPINGLFAITPTINPPITVTNGRLANTPALLDGTARINIVTPLNSPPPPPGTEINLGLSFSNPVSLNTIFLQVISGTNLTPLNISQISGRFSWDIYTSNDQGNTWVRRLTVANAPFGRDPSSPGSDSAGFIISIPELSTQFIKVVIAPPQLLGVIPPIGVDLNSILVTRIQAFLNQQVESGESISSSTISGNYNLNVKAKLLERPDLSYDFGFFLDHVKADQPLTYNYTLTNGLTLYHIFNDWISGSARVSDEYFDGSERKGLNSITYSTGLMLTPLPTLNHSIVYSGRLEDEETGGKKVDNSIYLNNSAELYRGVSVNLGGGYSTTSKGNGEKSDNLLFTSGVNLVPNSKLSLNLSYTDSTSNTKGGGKPSSKTYNRSFTGSTSYTPFPTLYLAGSMTVTMQSDQDTVILEDYSISWSPFQGGDLQFFFSYSESLNSAGNLRITSYSPGVRWNIRPGSSLDASYTSSKSRGDNVATIESTGITTVLRLTF
jgi:hypothetical protein